MKKQIFTVAALSAVLCLTGCGTNTDSTDTQTGAAETTTFNTTAAESAAETQSSAAETSAAETSAESTGSAAAETENAGTDAPEVASLAGTWRYEVLNQEQGDDSLFDTHGKLTVNADGTFRYEPTDGSEAKSGTVKLEYEQYADGTQDPFFAFYEEDGTAWIGCYISQNNADIYYIGNGGVIRIVRE